MKVSINAFRQAVANFEGRIVDTFKSPANRFIAAAALAGSNASLEAMVAPLVDEDGKIEIDSLKAMAKAGFDACDGTLVLVPEIPDTLRKVGFGIKDFTIKRADVEKFFSEMEGA